MKIVAESSCDMAVLQGVNFSVVPLIISAEYPDADIICYPAYGLNSFYAERNGFILGCECK